METEEPAIFKYMIDLDERGEFRASVRDVADHVIFNIEGFDLFEDGFLKDKDDLSSLQYYLRSIGFIGKDDEVLLEIDFERRLERDSEEGLYAFICVSEHVVSLRMGAMTAANPHKGNERLAQHAIDYFETLTAQYQREGIELRNDTKMDLRLTDSMNAPKAGLRPG